MFYLHSNARSANRGKRRSFSGRPEVETLEDRLVPSIADATLVLSAIASIADGTILVPTFPSIYVSPPDTDPPYPTGLIGIDPNTGAQSEISVGGNFVVPSDVKQAYAPLSGGGRIPPILVVDAGAGPHGNGELIAVDPNTRAQTVEADSSDGFLYQPIVLGIRNTTPQYIYVGNCGEVNYADFDTLDSVPWIPNTNNGGVVENSTVLADNYSLELNRPGPGPGTVANVTFGQNVITTPYLYLPTVTYSFLFRYHSQTGDACIANFQDATPGRPGFKGALHLNAPYGYLVFATATPGVTVPGRTEIYPDTTYSISVTVGTGPGNTTPFQVVLNGMPEITGQGYLGNVNNGSLLLGGQNPYISDYFYDNIKVLPPRQNLFVMLDPSHRLANGHYQQSFVTINGPGITVPQGLMAVPGDTASLCMSDEGGQYKDPGQGHIWKFTFTDPTHATQYQFGLPFPITPTDYRHASTMTQNLASSTLYPICGASGVDGVNPGTGYVAPNTAYNKVWDYGGNGMTMGNGYYGADTVFLNDYHTGPPDYPAHIWALNWADQSQPEVAISTGGYLSLPQFMSIFYSSGGSGYRPAPAPSPPTKPVIPVQPYNALSTPEGASLQSPPMSIHAEAKPLLFSASPLQLPQAREVAVGRIGPVVTRQRTSHDDLVDSLFAGLDNSL